MSKMITTKVGNKTMYRIVPDDYKEDDTDDRPIGDLTTSRRAFMSYTDIKQEKWDKIFSKEKKMKLVIYSAVWCTNCKMTKASLDQMGIKYDVIDVDDQSANIPPDIKSIPVAVLYDGDNVVSRWSYEMGDISNWCKEQKIS